MHNHREPFIYLVTHPEHYKTLYKIKNLCLLPKKIKENNDSPLSTILTKNLLLQNMIYKHPAHKENFFFKLEIHFYVHHTTLTTLVPFSLKGKSLTFFLNL